MASERDAIGRKLGAHGAFVAWSLIAAAPLTVSRPARAQAGEAATKVSGAEPSAAEKEQARGLMDLGRERFGEKRYAEALQAFEGADAIMGVPVTALAVAEALAATGKLILARDRLLTVARSQPVLRDGAEPEPYARARERAAVLAQELAVRIPSVRVEVLDAGGRDVTAQADVQIGTRTLSPAQRGLPQRIDPGEVRVRAEVDGRAVTPRDIDVDESEHHVVSLLAPVEDALPPPGGGPHPLVWIGIATGAAGAVFGGIFGGAALAKSSSLSARCGDDGLCPDAAAADEIDDMNRFATLSTVGFAVAGAGAVLGVVGIVLSFDAGAEADEDDGGGASAARLRLSPSGASVGWRF
ncbi:MAG: hypothetical protein AAGN82_03805 [Myxococcota bacterium]